jgi:23S rRNA pseudouridine1911/1915/1917 synthase
MIVAKNDAAHRKLAEQFSGREVKKTYVALVQGWPKAECGKIEAAIGRDRVRRVRMSTRIRAGRAAVSHYRVKERLETPWGKFALVEVQIETGRTHQIRVHMASLGHPVAGDTLYGAAREMKIQFGKQSATPPAPLGRNFLHAARIEFAHPRTGKVMRFESELPGELGDFLKRLRESSRHSKKDPH